MFSEAFQSLIGYCFFWPRVCWLLFSSSFVVLGICFSFGLLVVWALPVPSLPSPILPRRPPPPARGLGVPEPIDRGSAETPIDRVLGGPEPIGHGRWGPPFDGAQPTGSGALATHRRRARPLCPGGLPPVIRWGVEWAGVGGWGRVHGKGTGKSGLVLKGLGDLSRSLFRGLRCFEFLHGFCVVVRCCGLLGRGWLIG